MLRLVVSLNSVAQGWVFLSAPGAPVVEFWCTGVVLVIVGVSLLIGIITPVASSIAALAGAAAALSLLPMLPYGSLNDRAAAIEFLVIAVSLTFLGPGAFSLDARLYGRREIIIRDIPRSPRR